MSPVAVDYQPKGAALEAFSCHAPEVILSGPAGTGKSRSCFEKLHLCLMKYDGARALACRKTMKSLTDTGLVTYREKIKPERDDVSFFGGSRQEPAQFRYPNGSRLMVGGLDNPAKTLSSEYDIVYVQQAEELTENDWELLTRSLRWDVMPYQQMLADCNPDKPDHWLKRRADSGTLLMLESRHEDNPMLWQNGDWTPFGRGYIARLDALTGARKERLRYGRWAAAEGIVYDTYDRAIHVISESALPPIRSYLAAVDWGFTNAGVITVWGLDGDGRMYLVHEVYQSRKLIDWWVEQGKRIRETYHPSLFDCDPSEPAYIEAFAQAGLPVEAAFNAISLGIDAVQQRLNVAPDGRPRLFVVRDALAARDEELKDAGKPYSTDQEFDSYVWPKGIDGKPLKEVPVDADNHGLDTVRYAVAQADNLGGASLPYEWLRNDPEFRARALAPETDADRISRRRFAQGI